MNTPAKTFEQMNLRELLAAVSALRAEWHEDAADPCPFEIRGNRFFINNYSTGLSRADIVEQCQRLTSDMQAHHDENAVIRISARVPSAMACPAQLDAIHYTNRALALADVPRRIRLEAMAFVGLTTADILACAPHYIAAQPPHPYAGLPLTPAAALHSIMELTAADCPHTPNQGANVWYSMRLLMIRNAARAAIQADDKRSAPDTLAALIRLRNCPDVCMDSTEPETIAAAAQADAAIAGEIKRMPDAMKALKAALDLLQDPDAEPEQADAVTAQIIAVFKAIP